MGAIYIISAVSGRGAHEDYTYPAYFSFISSRRNRRLACRRGSQSPSSLARKAPGRSEANVTPSSTPAAKVLGLSAQAELRLRVECRNTPATRPRMPLETRPLPSEASRNTYAYIYAIGLATVTPDLLRLTSSFHHALQLAFRCYCHRYHADMPPLKTQISRKDQWACIKRIVESRWGREDTCPGVIYARS